MYGLLSAIYLSVLCWSFCLSSIWFFPFIHPSICFSTPPRCYLLKETFAIFANLSAFSSWSEFPTNCMCKYLHLHAHNTYTQPILNVYICMYVSIYVCNCICVSVYLCIYVCMYVCMYVCKTYTPTNCFFKVECHLLGYLTKMVEVINISPWFFPQLCSCEADLWGALQYMARCKYLQVPHGWDSSLCFMLFFDPKGCLTKQLPSYHN